MRTKLANYSGLPGVVVVAAGVVVVAAGVVVVSAGVVVVSALKSRTNVMFLQSHIKSKHVTGTLFVEISFSIEKSKISNRTVQTSTQASDWHVTR